MGDIGSGPLMKGKKTARRVQSRTLFNTVLKCIHNTIHLMKDNKNTVCTKPSSIILWQRERFRILSKFLAAILDCRIGTCFGKVGERSFSSLDIFSLFIA